MNLSFLLTFIPSIHDISNYPNIKWTEYTFACIFPAQDFNQKAEKELHVVLWDNANIACLSYVDVKELLHIKHLEFWLK